MLFPSVFEKQKEKKQRLVSLISDDDEEPDYDETSREERKFKVIQNTKVTKIEDVECESSCQ